MLLRNEDGTYTCGPADVLCIMRLPSGRFHVTFLAEKPMPDPIQAIGELDFLRLQSGMHHTVGADSLEGAQQHMVEMRKMIKLADSNVVADIAFDRDEPVCTLVVRNWIKERMPLKEALGLQTVE